MTLVTFYFQSMDSDVIRMGNPKHLVCWICTTPNHESSIDLEREQYQCDKGAFLFFRYTYHGWNWLIGNTRSRFHELFPMEEKNLLRLKRPFIIPYGFLILNESMNTSLIGMIWNISNYLYAWTQDILIRLNYELYTLDLSGFFQYS